MRCGEHAGAERLAVGPDRVQDRARGRVVVRAVRQAERTGGPALAPPVDPWIQSSTSTPAAGVASRRPGRRARGCGEEEVADEPELVVEPLDVPGTRPSSSPCRANRLPGAMRKVKGAGTSSPSTTSSSRRSSAGGFGTPDEGTRRARRERAPGTTESEVEPRAVQPGERAERLGDLQRADVADEGRGAPTRIVAVAAATAPMTMFGALPATPGLRWCSASQYRAYPARSAATARSTVFRSASAGVEPADTGTRSRTDSGTGCGGGHADTCWRSRTCRAARACRGGSHPGRRRTGTRRAPAAAGRRGRRSRRGRTGSCAARRRNRPRRAPARTGRSRRRSRPGCR